MARRQAGALQERLGVAQGDEIEHRRNGHRLRPGRTHDGQEIVQRQQVGRDHVPRRRVVDPVQKRLGLGGEVPAEAQQHCLENLLANAVKLQHFLQVLEAVGQPLEFLQAGGYRERSLWADRDWKWKEEAGISHPVFWTRVGDDWFYRTMFDQLPLPDDWPVYVSHAEASAYARWKGKRLPTEAEWHRAAVGTPDGRERD